MSSIHLAAENQYNSIMTGLLQHCTNERASCRTADTGSKEPSKPVKQKFTHWY